MRTTQRATESGFAQSPPTAVTVRVFTKTLVTATRRVVRHGSVLATALLTSVSTLSGEIGSGLEGSISGTNGKRITVSDTETTTRKL